MTLHFFVASSMNYEAAQAIGTVFRKRDPQIRHNNIPPKNSQLLCKLIAQSIPHSGKQDCIYFSIVFLNGFLIAMNSHSALF
jgi:hypothetical protein